MDGEVVVQDENGMSDFDALRSAIYKAPHQIVSISFTRTRQRHSMALLAREQDGELKFAGPAILRPHHVRDPSGPRSSQDVDREAGIAGAEARQQGAMANRRSG